MASTTSPSNPDLPRQHPSSSSSSIHSLSLADDGAPFPDEPLSSAAAQNGGVSSKTVDEVWKEIVAGGGGTSREQQPGFPTPRPGPTAGCRTSFPTRALPSSLSFWAAAGRRGNTVGVGGLLGVAVGHGRRGNGAGDVSAFEESIGEATPNGLEIESADLSRRRRSTGEDGGACSNTGKERVANPSGNIPFSDPEARQNRGIMERITGGTKSLESDTSRAGSNELENLSSGMPSEIQIIKCGLVENKRGFDGPRLGLSKGGEEVGTGPLYYVEEPDSPRPNSDVEKAKSPVELEIGPNSSFGNSLSVNLSKVGQCHRTGEEGLASAFNKALNLKRKGVEELERDQGKRLKESGFVEAGEQEFALLRTMIGLWWLALNSHGSNGDAQLECSGDRTTTDIPDLTRAMFGPSSSSGIPHGD
ncbi:hypothetical protein RHMOL_Rhmol04G0257500 [Rhododendron molle]|uniref:Uncharacterized protein n=1 Tax=Rhododendron molle TaxID=49168 RepID=A0ACC0P639_RHOML|nr:hypothetical protein RHMOL_Rhmol04G0257500 [Rhododendron molle]